MAEESAKPLCILIGAGEGLGASIARKFAAEGFALALMSRSEGGSAAALAAASEHCAAGEAAYYAADAGEPASITAACTDAQAAMGPARVLIYNVRGYYAAKAPLDYNFDELEQNYREEVIGALAAAKAVMPAMIETGSGTVIYSSATAGFRGSARNALYALGKFGLRGLAQSLAKAYAQDGVHVAHVRLDCDLDVPLVRQMYGDKLNVENLANTDDVAETYYWVHQQPRSAWSNEVELRPYTENWTF